MQGLVTFSFEKVHERILSLAGGDDVDIERCPPKAIGSHGQAADHGEWLIVLLEKDGNGADYLGEIHVNPTPGYRFRVGLPIPARDGCLCESPQVGVIEGSQAAGHWHTSITEEEYHRRLQELDSPLYTHVGGTAMAEETPDR